VHSTVIGRRTGTPVWRAILAVIRESARSILGSEHPLAEGDPESRSILSHPLPVWIVAGMGISAGAAIKTPS
jgi:hypothetical protein